jgi:hypothetical protein
MLYLSDELIAENFELSAVPSEFTAAMIASEMPAAIRPYSMAVAPDSSSRKRVAKFFISHSNAFVRTKSPPRDMHNICQSTIALALIFTAKAALTAVHFGGW